MRYIALEEAFFIPELAERQPMSKDGVPRLPTRWNSDVAQRFATRLPDFTEYRLPEMDEAGIDVQVLSLKVPGLQVDIEPELAVQNARFANDYTAEVVAKHPDRLAAFAALPLQDPAASAVELERAVNELGLRGALVNDCIYGPGGRYLDAAEYDEVWSALESLNVPLYLHPGAPAAENWQVLQGRPELYGAAWSWAAEVGGHALRLVFGAVFDRHPGAALILGHMGEFLPFQRSRLDSRYRPRTPKTRFRGRHRTTWGPMSCSPTAVSSPRRHCWERFWRSARTRSCSPSTTRTSRRTRRSRGSSARLYSTPTGQKWRTPTPSVCCG